MLREVGSAAMTASNLGDSVRRVRRSEYRKPQISGRRNHVSEELLERLGHLKRPAETL